MSLCRHLLRRTPPSLHLQRFSTTATTINHADHEFLPPNNYINSWDFPRDPKEAERKLAMLRRQYAKDVKAVRKEYIREVEVQKLEKIKKDQAKKEAMRIANEERKAAKVAQRKAKAKERELAEEEFRQALMKERAAKLEYWRSRTGKIKERKKEKIELIRKQSSTWIEEDKLEKKILEVVIDSTPL